MLRGSTLLSQNYYGSNVTPIITANIRSGEFLKTSVTNTNKYSEGLSANLNYPLGTAFIYKNQTVRYFTNSQTSTIATYYPAGTSAYVPISDFNLGISPLKEAGSFLDTGNTLLFTHIGNSGLAIDRYVSANGTSWSGLTRLYSGSSSLWGVGQAQEGRIYFLEEESGYASTSTLVTRNTLVSLKRLDVSLGTTTLKFGLFLGNKVNPFYSFVSETSVRYRNYLNCINIDNNDYIFLSLGISTLSGANSNSEINNNQSSYIKELIFDNNSNVLLEKELVPPSNGVVTLMGNISKGMSYYFMSMAFHNINLGEFYLKSLDLINWSTPIKSPPAVRITDAQDFGAGGDPIILSGRTTIEPYIEYFNELDNNQTNGGRRHIFEGISWYSVSNDIISISNSNNERISLTLANN